jgi:hypothetical protein
MSFSSIPVLENEYDSIYALNSSNFYLVKKESKLAVFDAKKQKFLTGFDYEELTYNYVNSGIYLAKKNGKYGILDYNFGPLIDFKYKEIKLDNVSKEYECILDEKSRDCFFAK